MLYGIFTVWWFAFSLGFSLLSFGRREGYGWEDDPFIVFAIFLSWGLVGGFWERRGGVRGGTLGASICAGRGI